MNIDELIDWLIKVSTLMH